MKLTFYLSDRAPQILDMANTLEWNRDSSAKIFCSATGNPLPSHASIELRKLDSTVLKVKGHTVAPVQYDSFKLLIQTMIEVK